MKLLLSRDLSKCRINKSDIFPKNSDLKKFFSEATKVTLSYLNLSKPLKNTLVSVFITSDSYIRKLNSETRGKDKPTNVLSFPYLNFKKGNICHAGVSQYPKNNQIFGDIVFGAETCIKEAKEQNKELINHLTHLYIHSLLHLLGFDHISKKDETEMENIEINLLKKIGISNPY